MSSRYPNDAATIARQVNQLDATFASAGVTVNVLAGAEIAITHVSDLGPDELAALALGKGPWLLIEPPFTSVAIGLDTLIWELQDRGHRVVLAHPERCTAFHRDPAMLGTLVDSGVLTSVTAGAFVGRFGDRVRRFAHSLAEAEMLHNVSSDAHDAHRRPPGMSAELEQCGLGQLREWLTETVPAAIIAGEESIPRRPAVAVPSIEPTRRPWWARAKIRRAS